VVFTGAFHRGERQRGKPRQAPFAAEFQSWPPLGAESDSDEGLKTWICVSLLLTAMIMIKI